MASAEVSIENSRFVKADNQLAQPPDQSFRIVLNRINSSQVRESFLLANIE